MKGLTQLWRNAQEVTQTALKRADAEVYGTERAKQQYQQMTPGERLQMEQAVVQKYGETSWDDFIRAIGKENSDASRK